MTQASFKEALVDVAEIMQFENWLRFYFLQQEDETLYVRIPEPAMQHFQEKYPHLAPLADSLNNESITYEKSVSTVCQYVVSRLDGSKYRAGLVSAVLDSAEFQDEMYLFQVWCQTHEAQLEQAPMEFVTWQKLYGDWKQTEAVQKLASRERGDRQRTTSCSTKTVQ